MKKYFGLLTLALSVAFTACKKDTVDEGGVTPSVISGCMDENAENFNSEATEDDGSCSYSVAYLVSGDWNITSLTYATEIDLSTIDASNLDAIFPGLSTMVAFMDNVPVEGTADNAGTYTVSHLDNTYASDLSFTTESITISGFDIPGIPIDLASEGDWTLQDNETEMKFTDGTTGVDQVYDIENSTEELLELEGSVIVSQDVPMLGLYEFEVELELTLEK